MKDFEVRRGTWETPRWRIEVWRGNAQIATREVFARTPDLAMGVVRPQYGLGHTYTITEVKEGRRR